MALMIPQFPPADARSKAEVRTFYRIREELGPSWTALHSLGLGSHRLKPWAEIDFVLIGGPGVFCLEVKGGRVRRAGGTWMYVDGADTAHPDNEGPFAQVGGASTALYNYLRQVLPRSTELLVGFGVVTPEFEFNITGPDIIREIVYDIEDTNRSFEAYMARLSNYWHDRTLRPRNKQMLPDTTRTAIKNAIRGDFDLEPCLRHQLGFVNEQLCRLTQEQYDTIDGLVDNARVVVSGGPGTGKSLLALREARRLAADGRRVLVCCFSDHLASHLKAACDAERITVVGLRRYMRGMVAQAGLQHRLPPAEEVDLDQVFYPELCTELALDWTEDRRYDALIVDEAQDIIREGYLDFFDAALNGGLAKGIWRFFADNQQDVYRNREPLALQRIGTLNPTQFKLRVNCRNTRPIACATALLSRVPLSETRVAEGPDVTYKWYTNVRHQGSMVSSQINIMLSGGLEPEQIVLLTTRRSLLKYWLTNLERVSSPVVKLDSSVTPKRAVRLGSVEDFKGLEADAIVLTDLDDLNGASMRETIYVGTSRARVFLTVFISEASREAFDQCGTVLGLNLGNADAGRR